MNNDVLRIDPEAFELKSVEFNGKELVYKAYEHLQYVVLPVDVSYQSMNVFVPVSYGDRAFQVKNAPVILANKCGGYSSVINIGEKKGRRGGFPKRLPPPNAPRIGPAPEKEGVGEIPKAEFILWMLTGGFIVADPGNRGHDCVTEDGVYYGKAPAMIVDLKAAVRFIRYNAHALPWDTEHIISRGTSAGGGLSALLASSGNEEMYLPYLEELGAAEERDDVFAGICISPVMDLEHQDMSYEWIFGPYTLHDNEYRPTGPVDQEKSGFLAKQYAEYLNSLNLECRGDYGKLTADNYRDYYYREFVMPAAERWFYAQDAETQRIYAEDRPWFHWDGEKISFSFEDYNTYVGRFKGLPAFDKFELGMGENQVFGSASERARHFTEFSIRETSGDPNAEVPEELMKLRELMNPMMHLYSDAGKKSGHWWIRLGGKECGFGLPLVVSMATKVENLDYDVNFRIVWDGGHCAEDDIEDEIRWISEITGYTGC